MNQGAQRTVFCNSYKLKTTCKFTDSRGAGRGIHEVNHSPVTQQTARTARARPRGWMRRSAWRTRTQSSVANTRDAGKYAKPRVAARNASFGQEAALRHLTI